MKPTIATLRAPRRIFSGAVAAKNPAIRKSMIATALANTNSETI